MGHGRDAPRALILSPAVLAVTTASAFVFGCAKRIPSNDYAWVAFLLAWSVSFLATICLVGVVAARGM